MLMYYWYINYTVLLLSTKIECSNYKVAYSNVSNVSWMLNVFCDLCEASWNVKFESFVLSWQICC